MTASQTPARRRRRRAQSRAGVWLVLPALLVVGGFYLFPAAFNIFLSLRDVTIFNMASAGSGWAGLDNFVTLFTAKNIWHILWNTTFWLTAVTVVIRMAVGLGLALVLNSAIMRIRGIGALSRSLLVLPWTVPPVAAILVWQFLLQPRYGGVNQLLEMTGLVPPGGIAWFQQVETVWAAVNTIIVWRELPLIVLMFIAGLQTIDPEIYEAARVDGAGFWRQLFQITLPLIQPVTAVTALLTIIQTYNNFVYVWVSTRGGPGDATQVLGTTIYKQGFVEYDIGLSSATAVVGIAIMAVFAVLYFLRTMRVED
ncbi:MAG: sugar ABC transporter permease [Propionicimonas sp.]